MRRGMITGVLAVVLVGAPTVSIVGAQASGPGWTISPTRNPTASGGLLTGVACPSATDCIAVGQYTDPSGDQVALAEHWNGTIWSIQTTPPPANQVSAFEGVACSAPGACTAVGYAYDGAGVRIPLGERWDGSAWTIQTTPDPPGAGATSFAGVSCASASSCTAVGSSVTATGTVETLAEQWNGTSWTIQATPNPAGAVSSSFAAVSCVSPGVCSAVGASTTNTAVFASNLAEQSSGATWTIETTPTSSDGPLAGVSCTDQNFCVGVGARPNNPETETWNGIRWRMEPNPVTRASFASVSCTALNACTAAGTAVARLSATGVWTAEAMVPPGGSEVRVSGVSCDGAADCTMVGSDDLGARFQPFIERWNGTSWSAESTPSPAAAVYLSFFESVSCTSATQCMAVGSTTNANGGEVPLAEQWRGTSWSKLPIPNAGPAKSFNRLDSVSCTSADMCVAVGLADNSNSAVAELWDGRTWTLDPIADSGLHLVSVSCTSPTTCTAVGDWVTPGQDNAAVAQWDGTSWSVQPLALPPGSGSASLRGISCASVTACVAVGDSISDSIPSQEYTLAEQWNGSAWLPLSTPNPSPVDSELVGVSCTTTMCFAVGDADGATVAELWNGSTWSVEPTPTPAVPPGATFEYASLGGVTCVSADACTAVGSYVSGNAVIDYPASTLVETWDGITWTAQPSPNPIGRESSELDSVSCLPGGACMAVGAGLNTSTYDVTLAEQYTP
jgi:hypothetical protein